MSFSIFLTADGVHYRHVDSPLSVQVLDSKFQPASAEFHPLDDDYGCLACPASNRFVLGYWSTADLTVYDLQSGVERASFPYRQVSTMVFDETGAKLLFGSRSQVILLDFKSSRATQIKGVRALDSHVLVPGKNQLICPSQKKGELISISFKRGSVAIIPIPITATLFDLKQNPADRQLLVAIDRKKGVHCLNSADWSVVWSVSLKKELAGDHMGVGQFCGNGELFVGATSETYSLVLDAHTGRVVRRIDNSCYGLPWHGTCVCDDEVPDDTYSARILDLKTGKESGENLLPDRKRPTKKRMRKR